MALLIMMRHGESEWNKRNLFTGWVDIPLSSKGIEEALAGGQKISHLPIDLIFVSSLIRAQMTAMLAMSCHQSGKIPYLLHPEDKKLTDWGQIYSEEALKMLIPVTSSWQLNERMYGTLQGLNKRETMDRYGEEQVQIWRRSYDIAPPGGESLKMTLERALPFFEQQIIPHLREEKNVFISAHGNSLRAIIMKIEQLSEEEVVRLELATGDPIVYGFYKDRWSKKRINEIS